MTTEEKLQHFYKVSIESAKEEADKAISEYRASLEEDLEKHKKEKNEPVSKEQKLQWLTKFFRRMSTSLYKWTIMPPSPIVDARSINKSEYVQPIISSKINYFKTSFEDKLKDLENC